MTYRLDMASRPDLPQIFRALGDEQRWEALRFISVAGSGGQPVCACDVQTHLGLTQPTVSHHMRVLVDARLVRAERRGRWSYYTIDPDGFAAALDAAKELLIKAAGRPRLPTARVT